MDDIDAVVIGKAPDFFEGVMMPELYLADALGAVGKPMIRVHTAGSVGGSTAIVAAQPRPGRHPRARAHRRVREAVESEAMWALSLPIPFQPPLVAGAGGYFAPLIRAYMRRSGAPDDIGILVALKDRLNALKNPYAHLHEPDITFDSVKESIMLWDPIRYSETCPSPTAPARWCSPTRRRRGRRRRRVAAGVDPRHRHALRAHDASGRDQVTPQAGRDCAADVYAQAGITDPASRSTSSRCTCRSPGTSRCGSRTSASPPRARAGSSTEDGVTQIDGDLPVNCSGGVLSSNPIGASGMIRFAEAALQVRGQAGEHQIDGARIALGHAYGGGSQFFAMWVVGADKP